SGSRSVRSGSCEACRAPNGAEAGRSAGTSSGAASRRALSGASARESNAAGADGACDSFPLDAPGAEDDAACTTHRDSAMSDVAATTDVVVAGAGPTGLALGCVLAAEGVSFALVDKLPEGTNTSRAAVVHARTLEVLDELKVTDRLRAEGVVVPRFTLRDRDSVLATI